MSNYYGVQEFSSAKTARFGRGAVIMRARHGETLSEGEILAAAPSVFAAGAHGSRTDKYSYIPTIEVLRGLIKEGFVPVEVRQGGSKDEEKRGFTKHLIRLRHAGETGAMVVGGDSVRELVLLNAHDGTSSYQLMSGLFRMICTNGLITCEGGEIHRVPHKGEVRDNVIQGAYTILSRGEAVAERVGAMQALQLSGPEQGAFAMAALELRFNEKDENGEVKKAPVGAESLLRVRRADDAGNDMWKVFNRVQESVIRGGQHYTHRAATGRLSHRETRPVNSIDGNVTLNRALWVLAQKMAEIKQAA